MITNSVICCETAKRPARSRCATGRGYLVTMVNLYHDTMPKSQDAITWPSAPLSLRDLAARRRRRAARRPHRGRLHARAAPPTRCPSRSPRWGDVGMDQLVFGLPVEGMHHDEILALPRALRRQGHPRVRQGPHALDRPLPGDRRKPKFGTFTQPLPERRVADRHPGERARAARAEPADALRPCLATPPPPRRLLREAERLFARRGLYQVTVREITEAAGQRNVSALNYHFGSREGVLDAILDRHGDPTDVARGELLDAVGPRRVDRAISSPRSSCRTPRTCATRRAATTCASSRSCRRGSARGATRHPGTGPYLRRDPRHPRGRARRSSPRRDPARAGRRADHADDGRDGRAGPGDRVDRDALELDEPTFVANLTDVLVGVLEAPARVPR